MIFSSYFSNKNLKKFPRKLISIARYTPQDFQGLQIVELAPSPEVLSFKDDIEAFTEKYIEYLDSIELEKILKGLNEINEDVVLLCYEPPHLFCHRHILSRIAYDKFGISIKEL